MHKKNSINYFLLCKPFDFNELNKIHKSHMVEKFKKDKINEEYVNGYNTIYDDDAYTSIISKAFLNIVEKNFIVSSLTRPIKTWIYVQNNVHSNNVWHTHVSTSSINAVYYIDPPKRGGGLSLRYLGEETIIRPEPNMLYIFPYWLEHKPEPQKDEDWRISVNIEYMCDSRPIVKETGVMW